MRREENTFCAGIKRLAANPGKKRSSQVSWEACSLGTPIPQICVVSIYDFMENCSRSMVNNALKWKYIYLSTFQQDMTLAGCLLASVFLRNRAAE